MEPQILSPIERARQVKDYLCTNFCEEPLWITKALDCSREEGLKEIQVPQNVGKTLYMLAKLIRSKRILEIRRLQHPLASQSLR